MVAYEQANSRSCGSGDGKSSSSNSFASHQLPQSHSMSWELHSFLKLYGHSGTLALRWFKSALEKLLPLLQPLDAASTRTPHPAAAQAARYRACMLGAVQKQLLLLDGCNLRA
jgi:hypothetical protein